ncbi:hypothetical protein THASP1DRAFT_29428 [Thamnocephalis sphaerospora]|uniref:Translation initiation factor eIF2B subunit delta n=1 Tax=Thamnocephalis sphaerospora TaxID=78915 RepID=A0A4P9XS39_9FUNG|nr:hypothetical protein THASP1DRAFT_29428 [Thamnocephalis sphaerospora]|eukprot:RKP08782.1 hypothetical protein THASP1DRAFT_29428 [Thamnocephalis sphaerospora]
MDATKPTPSSPVPASSAGQGAQKKSMKEMTKKERRELQEKQRAEKAAQRQAAEAGGANKAKKPTKPTAQPKTVSNAAPVVAAKSGAAQRNPIDEEYPSLLAHLHVAKGTTGKADRDVHPAVLTLGLAYAEHRVCGSNARCVALLCALKTVISDYQTPPNMHISRHLQTYLSPQINYLVGMRPMSVSMGNAVRYLKYEISILDVDMTDEEAKTHIIGRIDSFINERILRADEELVEHALRKIQDGDVVLTFARSSVVEKVLLAAKKRNIDFRVIVVDSRPLLEGKYLLQTLNAAGIDCTYTWINGLSVAMASATKVFLGAHAMLSNGAMLSRVGAASVALAASEHRVPVLVCCETYKFTDRVQLDAFVWNELGKCADGATAGVVGHLADHLLPGRPEHLLNGPTESPVKAMLDNPRLKLLSMVYDVTPSSLISLVVTDIGMIPCESVSMVLREYKPMMQQ